MIGLHSVMVYAEPNSATFSAPVLSNPNFAANADGWTNGPTETPWVWSAGRMHADDVHTLQRLTASVPLRPPVVETWRLRTTFDVNFVTPTDQIQATVWAYVTYGATQIAAAQGPFWQPGLAVETWTALNVGSGRQTVEFTLTPPVADLAAYPYVSARFVWNQLGVTPGVGFKSVDVYGAELAYRAGGASADVSCLVDEVSIQHGRDDTASQPEAAAATLEFTTDPDNPLPSVVDIGAVVVVTTTLGETESTRFTGRVTDVRLGWDDEGEDTPDAGVGQFIAVSTLADLGNRIVGDTPWPQELDGARVARVLELASMPVDPLYSDPGTVQILPRDVDSQPALDVAHDAAESAGGLVWHTRNGEVRYADADHRRGTPVSVELDACDVLVTPTWLRDLTGMVNGVSIGYGVAEEGSDQPRYVAADVASQARYGRRAISATTDLAALIDATAMGQLLLARNARPVWMLTGLPVDMRGLSKEDTGAVLTLELGDLVRVAALPVVGAAPTAVAAWVEGWRERLAWDEHELELVVSDYCRTVPPPRWNDVPPTITWNTVPGTWNDAACLGPPANLGRWDDVPATTRWDQIPPAVTWDTATQGV